MWAGLREPPVMARHWDRTGWKPSSSSASVKGESCYRPEGNWGHPRKGAEDGLTANKGRPLLSLAKCKWKIEGKEAQDAIPRGQASLSQHRREDRLTEVQCRSRRVAIHRPKGGANRKHTQECAEWPLFAAWPVLTSS